MEKQRLRPLLTLWLTTLFFVAMTTSSAYGQTPPTTDSDNSNEASVNQNDSPRHAVREMLSVMSGASAIPMTMFFDLRPTFKLKQVNAPLVIDRFATLLDTQGGLQPIGLISDKPEGSQNPQYGLDKEKIGTFRIEDRQFDILLERVSVSQNEKKWLISQDTIVLLSQAVEALDTSKIDQLLPSALKTPEWRGANIGQWIAAALLSIVAAVLGWLVVKLGRLATTAYLNRHPDSKIAQASTALSIPAGLTFAAFSFLFVERYLEFSILIRQDFSFAIITVLWVALFVFLWSLIDTLSSRGEKILRERNRVGSLSIVVFFRASAKVCLFVLALILVLNTNGIDVTTGLAALGIGGIALALGAQKAIENLVGSIIIVTDQPLRVGDFCQIGDVIGTIENIGLRSTRIRTLADTVVTLPNGLLSSERIENYTMRRKFLLRTVLNLRYETEPKALQTLLGELRAHLSQATYVFKDGARVRFISYGSASLDVEIYAYLKASNYDEFLARQEDLLLGMYEIVNKRSGFAFPSQTVYLAKDSQPN